MGANYDLLIANATDQKKVVEATISFLDKQGLKVVCQATTEKSASKLHLRTDNVVFVGPQRRTPWVPLACQAPCLNIFGAVWWSQNPFAVDLSSRVGPTIFIWSLDSSFVAGYSLYENGELTESQVRFCPLATGREQLFPGVPTPASLNGGRLAMLLGDTEFDYHRFLSQFSSLELATGILASRFGLDVHLLDATSLVEGEPAIAIIHGQYCLADLAGWTAIVYE